MIPDDGIAVVTPEGAMDGETQTRVRRLVEALRAASHPDMDALRELQPFVTTVPRSALRKPGVAALLHSVLGDVGQPGGLAEWIGEYDQVTGIVLDPDIEEFVL
jgi:CRISPR-associated endonuclease/helicase Cas3